MSLYRRGGGSWWPQFCTVLLPCCLTVYTASTVVDGVVLDGHIGHLQNTLHFCLIIDLEVFSLKAAFHTKLFPVVVSNQDDRLPWFHLTVPELNGEAADIVNASQVYFFACGRQD